jgi:rhodanese-related sulfurtransferase
MAPAITKLADHGKSCGIPGGHVRQVKVPEITATELKKMVEERTPFVLIDVREPHEYQICRIPGAKLMPLGDVLKRMHELNSAEEIVVHCRSGVRSARAVEWLMKAGFRRVRNLKGGVLSWAEQVDPSVPKY